MQKVVKGPNSSHCRRMLLIVRYSKKILYLRFKTPIYIRLFWNPEDKTVYRFTSIITYEKARYVDSKYCIPKLFSYGFSIKIYKHLEFQTPKIQEQLPQGKLPRSEQAAIKEDVKVPRKVRRVFTSQLQILYKRKQKFLKPN